LKTFTDRQAGAAVRAAKWRAGKTDIPGVELVPLKENDRCRDCGQYVMLHGRLPGGRLACPGDWIVLGEKTATVVRPGDFEAKYEEDDGGIL